MPLLSQVQKDARVTLTSGHIVIVGEVDGAYRWVRALADDAQPVRLALETPCDVALDADDPLAVLLDADRITIRRTLATLDRDQLARVADIGVPLWVKGEAARLLAGQVEAPAPAEEVACPVCTASAPVVLSAKGATVAIHAGPDGSWCSGSGKPTGKPSRARTKAPAREAVAAPEPAPVALPPAPQPAPAARPAAPPVAVQAPAVAPVSPPSLSPLLRALDDALRAAAAAGVGLTITLTVPPRSPQ